jgi:N-acyl-D-amino-acid deacylase
MSALPATTFQMNDRGTITTGKIADLVVFDPATVNDPSTFEDPHHYATGFTHVLVNGVPVIQDSKLTGKRPGKAYRHPSAP